MDCGPPGSSICVDFPGKNTGVRCYALFQGIFPTQRLNLPYWRQILYYLSHQGSPMHIRTSCFSVNGHLGCFPSEEKAMAPHSSTLAWKIAWTEEPGGLQSMGLLRVRQTECLHFDFSLYALEKEMATHSSILAWRIPGTGEPGGLPSMGSCRVGLD